MLAKVDKNIINVNINNFAEVDKGGQSFKNLGSGVALLQGNFEMNMTLKKFLGKTRGFAASRKKSDLILTIS